MKKVEKKLKNNLDAIIRVWKKRHRNTIEILRFLIFYQKNLPQDKKYGYQSIDLEEILDEASLPPVLDPPGCGVIWIPCGMGFQEEQKTLDKVKEIMTTLQGRHRPNSGLIGRFGFPWVPFKLNQKVRGSSPN